MTDYLGYTADEYAPDAPATSLHFRRWFENWIAGFEGAPGAPKLQGKALNIDIGTLSGTTAIVNIAGASKILLVGQAKLTSTSSSIEPAFGYQLSANNGSTWGAVVNIASTFVSYGSAGSSRTATATGAQMINMIGYNAIRLSGTGALSGEVFYLEGN